MTEAAKVIPIAIRKLKSVRMRLPPARLFDELLGCSGNRRFLALCWSRAIRAPILNDGIFEVLGAPDPYRVWRYHPGVNAALAGYNIGDAVEIADHWLLVDRKSRALYVGDAADVMVILEYQKRGVIDPLHEVEPVRKSGDTLDSMRESGAITTKKYKKPMTFDIKLLHELEAWLKANVTGY